MVKWELEVEMGNGQWGMGEMGGWHGDPRVRSGSSVQAAKGRAFGIASISKAEPLGSCWPMSL